MFLLVIDSHLKYRINYGVWGGRSTGCTARLGRTTRAGTTLCLGDAGSPSKQVPSHQYKTSNFLEKRRLSSEHPTQRQEPQSGGLCQAMKTMLGAAKHRITSFQTPTEGSGLPPDCLVWQFVFWKAMLYIHEERGYS